MPGFGLRLRKGGSRTWVFWYRVGRQRRKLPIQSKPPPLLPAKANKRAAILHAEAKLGGDPAGAKAAGKALCRRDRRCSPANLPSAAERSFYACALMSSLLAISLSEPSDYTASRLPT